MRLPWGSSVRLTGGSSVRLTRGSSERLTGGSSERLTGGSSERLAIVRHAPSRPLCRNKLQAFLQLLELRISNTTGMRQADRWRRLGLASLWPLQMLMNCEHSWIMETFALRHTFSFTQPECVS